MIATDGALRRYRDDGPLAVFARRVRVSPVPAWLLVAVGLAAPAVVAISDLDTGVLAPAVGWAVLLAGWSAADPHESSLDWLAVVLLRAGEYSVLAAVGLHAGVEPAVVFALLGAIAFHQYDVVYRLRHGLRLPGWLDLIGLGWAGRLLLVVLAVAVDHASQVYGAMTTVLWALYLLECVSTWVVARPAVPR